MAMEMISTRILETVVPPIVSVASASVDHRQPGIHSNPFSLLIASYFYLPSRSRDPRLQDSFGEEDSVVNTESDKVDDLISATQVVSVDDETIGTPSFFPSAIRQLTPDVPFESVPPANVVEKLSRFLTAGAHIIPSPSRAETSA